MFQLCNQQLSEERLEQMGVHIFEELSKMKVALVVVDFQNDFISGSLSVQVRLSHHTTCSCFARNSISSFHYDWRKSLREPLNWYNI